MRIAYLYNRDFSEGTAMGAEKTFADYTKTKRADLVRMIGAKGVREGDVVCVRAVGDFGQGAESKRIQDRLIQLGATIEVVPGNPSKRLSGRPTKAQFDTLEDWEDGCEIWYSPYPESEALERIGDKVGAEVDKNWANYQCGIRSGRDRAAKRKIMQRRLEKRNSKEAD